MNDIIAHLKNASRACTDGYECSLSIREVRHVVALLAEKDAEIARLREALGEFEDAYDQMVSDGVSDARVELDFARRRARAALAPLSPAPEVEQFVKALESAPKPTA